MATFYYPQITAEDYPEFRKILPELPVQYGTWEYEQDAKVRKARYEFTVDPRGHFKGTMLPVRPREFLTYCLMGRQKATLALLETYASERGQAAEQDDKPT